MRLKKFNESNEYPIPTWNDILNGIKNKSIKSINCDYDEMIDYISEVIADSEFGEHDVDAPDPFDRPISSDPIIKDGILVTHDFVIIFNDNNTVEATILVYEPSPFVFANVVIIFEKELRRFICYDKISGESNMGGKFEIGDMFSKYKSSWTDKPYDYDDYEDYGHDDEGQNEDDHDQEDDEGSDWEERELLKND